MANESKNPTGRGNKELDLNDASVKLPRRGGKFELSFEEARMFDNICGSLKLTEAQLAARYVKAALAKLM